MKNTTKMLLAGLAGYFIGYYEMKYKVMKVVIEGYAEKGKDSEK